MEPTLVVLGLNYRSAPVAIRERYWMSESQTAEALEALGRAEGIEESSSSLPATAPSS